VSCVVDYILKEFNTLFFFTRFRTYKIATPPQTKTPVKTTFAVKPYPEERAVPPGRGRSGPPAPSPSQHHLSLAALAAAEAAVAVAMLDDDQG
jgi:hypothetical protein